MANIGADKILDEADNICADPREQNRYLNYRNCAHGMGHGFMGLYGNEVFESLEGCDALSEEWEREQCSGGGVHGEHNGRGGPEQSLQVS